jgi:hypothetical protein
MAKVLRNFHCAFNDAQCNDSRCRKDRCAPQQDEEAAFRTFAPPTPHSPEESERARAFARECREVVKLVCRLNKVRPTKEIIARHLNHHKVIAEAMRRLSQKRVKL